MILERCGLGCAASTQPPRNRFAKSAQAETEAALLVPDCLTAQRQAPAAAGWQAGSARTARQRDAFGVVQFPSYASAPRLRATRRPIEYKGQTVCSRHHFRMGTKMSAQLYLARAAAVVDAASPLNS
eukprot:GHVT01077881.1.p1 GENE.GHVT01077881.1~~GHVT01077881.1.p1  ORF type:complete len:127 (-),score=22.50 GHVT01077881.1:331-711(-)